MSFCPPVAEALAAGGYPQTCTPSLGTEDNMARVRDAPADLAFGQFDVFVLRRPDFGGPRALTPVRVDDARECIYAVTRNETLTSLGDIAVRARQLRIVLPPKSSGSAGTFRFLQSIDRDLAAVREVINVETTEEAIRFALAADDTIAVFVQFPDPDNARFRLVGELGGHFVPLIDRSILSQKIDGQYVYFAQETEVADARWLKKATSIVTACTPIVLFTGAPGSFTNPQERAAQEARIGLLRKLQADKLLPKDSLLGLVLKKTRALSAAAAENLISLSDKAREKTGPLIEKAQEATSKALEGAKPHIDKAKESGAKTLERAKDTVKDLIEPAKPE
ncbi:MAG: hypothetical protein AB7E80_05060 [Hyphomicrobiaceae bacterium]